MKIQPKKIWRKGNDEFATELKIMITDNCVDSASIQYHLYNENNYALEIDKLNMSGEAYENWDSNDYVYNWVANVLGLELINE